VVSQTTSKLEWSDLDERTVNLIRVLAMDAVENEGSGHPGTAMSLAPAAYLLYQRIMRHDPPTRPGPAGTGSCCPAGIPA
jgi:transketolase